MSKDTMTHYRLLGVDEDADPATIKASYRRLARQVHPDMHGGDHTRSAAVNDAYHVLSTPNLRSEYDRRLQHERSIGTPQPTRPAATPTPANPSSPRATMTGVDPETDRSVKVITVLPILWAALASLAASAITAVIVSAIAIPSTTPSTAAAVWTIAALALTLLGAGVSFGSLALPRREMFAPSRTAVALCAPTTIAAAIAPVAAPNWAVVIWLLAGALAGFLLGSMAWDTWRDFRTMSRIVRPRALRVFDTFGESAPGVGAHLLDRAVDDWTTTPGVRIIRTAAGSFPVLAVRDHKIAALLPVILTPGRYFWSGTSLLRRTSGIPHEALTLRSEPLHAFRNRLGLEGVGGVTIAATLVAFPSGPGVVEFENEPPGDYIVVQAAELARVHEWLRTDTRAVVRQKVMVAASLGVSL